MLRLPQQLHVFFSILPFVFPSKFICVLFALRDTFVGNPFVQFVGKELQFFKLDQFRD